MIVFKYLATWINDMKEDILVFDVFSNVSCYSLLMYDALLTIVLISR